MAIAHDSCLFADSLGDGLPEGYPNIFNCVMRIDVQIALRDDVDVNQPMTANLVEHVFEKRHTRFQLAMTITIQIDTDLDLSLTGITLNLRLALVHCLSPVNMKAILKNK
jgi:hypothetical protein